VTWIIFRKEKLKELKGICRRRFFLSAGSGEVTRFMGAGEEFTNMASFTMLVEGNEKYIFLSVNSNSTMPHLLAKLMRH
jgi:hypothetical protein